MCQHVIILAERSPQQYISQCEHGTVNLVWDAVGVHLPAAQFVLLAERILRTYENVDDSQPTEAGRFHLQVGKTVVLLPMAEFTPLVEMLSAALPLIDQKLPRGSRPILQLRFPGHPLANVLN